MGNEPGLSRAPTVREGQELPTPGTGCASPGARETAHTHVRPRKIYPTAMTLPWRDEDPAVQESEVSLQ